MIRTVNPAKWGRQAGRALVFLAFAAAVVVLMLWLAGKFQRKVPGDVPVQAAETMDAGTTLVAARYRSLPRSESAVGTVRPIHETSIGSKLLAKVTEVSLRAGQGVKKDEVLVRLDDGDLQAKLQQARAAVEHAKAVRAQAVNDEQRYAELRKTRAVSQQDYEKAATALRSAEAELLRVQAAVNEVQATLDWATIRSPMNGIVVDKKVDVGDMVSPGQTVLTMFDKMQLVAAVRESLALRLQVGDSVPVQLESLDKTCLGIISEKVPEANPASRSFLVKVTGPCPPGVFPGMFGRIIVPLGGDEQVLVIPARAVRRVGQLELVDVVEGGQVLRRSVRTGRRLDQEVEVLSGLREGEKVLTPPATDDGTSPDAAASTSPAISSGKSQSAAEKCQLPTEGPRP